MTGCEELTERLLNLLASCEESKIYKCCDPNAGDCAPPKLVYELEWEEEQVYPHGVPNVYGVDASTVP